MKNITIYGTTFLLGILIGSLIEDIPYFSLETKIRPFEAATFLTITIFGYWYQINQKRKDNKFSIYHKVIENCINETCSQINKIISITEDNLNKEVENHTKNIIHQELRNISVNIDFIKKKTNAIDIENLTISFKEAVANDDFSNSDFKIGSHYFRNISNAANKLKTATKDSICNIT